MDEMNEWMDEWTNERMGEPTTPPTAERRERERQRPTTADEVEGERERGRDDERANALMTVQSQAMRPSCALNACKGQQPCSIRPHAVGNSPPMTRMRPSQWSCDCLLPLLLLLPLFACMLDNVLHCGTAFPSAKTKRIGAVARSGANAMMPRGLV